MALIIAGVVLGVALLLTGLAVTLMVVLSRNHFEVRLTYALPAGVEDGAVQEVVLDYKDKDGTVPKLRLGPTELTGNIISSATAEVDKNKGGNSWMISFSLADAATHEFADLTTELRGQTSPFNQLAIVLDYKIEACPSVNEAITGGKGQVTGDFTRQHTEDLALVLRLGVLPIRFTGPPVVEKIE